MTDIFARKPVKAAPNVPSLRYELFIKKIEMEVVAAQSRIKALEAMEQVYNIVRDALEACRLPNDTKLNLAASCVQAELKAVPTDKLANFSVLAKEIGQRLLTAGLHRDGEPSTGTGNSWRPIMAYRWALTAGTSYRIVDLQVELPEAGLSDCIVRKVDRTYTVQEYVLEPTDPRAARPVADDAEIAF